MNPTTTAATNILFDNIGHHSYFFDQIRDHIQVYGYVYERPVYGSTQATLQNQRAAATYTAATGRERFTTPPGALSAEAIRRWREAAERAASVRRDSEMFKAYGTDSMNAVPDPYSRYEPVMPPKPREMPQEEF